MEFFKRAKAVRFRSHHNKYLLAADDEESVWQDREGHVRNARWMVEINENGTAIRLKSCYGRYLTTSNISGLMMKSKKVLQTLPKTLDTTVEWEPISEGHKLKLKTPGHGQYLRANGGMPPWRNSVTYDNSRGAKEWVLWDVDVVEIDMDQMPKKTTTTTTTTKRISASDGEMDDNSDSQQQPDTACSSDNEMMMASPPPVAKRNKKSKIRRGVVRKGNELKSMLFSCGSPVVYDKKRSKPS